MLKKRILLVLAIGFIFTPSVFADGPNKLSQYSNGGAVRCGLDYMDKVLAEDIRSLNQTQSSKPEDARPAK